MAMTIERMRTLVDASGPETVPGRGPCHLWTMSVNGRGYGQFTHEGKVRVAHTWLHEQVYGTIPAGMQRDHVCHNLSADCPGGRDCLHRRCVNPDHLEVVDNATNARRGLTGERAGERMARKTQCPQGHPYDDANTYVGTQRLRNGGTTVNRACRTCKRERKRKSRAAQP